ncbi:hypothetical protein [Flavobacterium sp. I3-2]|uniref:hypothetical protein n=1 Tax=Flavobacterium sp. I3-2 TaxID=2748319 RepID=UPI0015A81AB4|nr:hypothetical protein [Flavobacterium sp. I3-2]
MRKIVLLSLFISLTLFGCSNSDDKAENCLDFKHAFITTVYSEQMSINKNEDLPIDLSFFIENSCGSFYSFEVERNDKVYNIRVKAKYEGCQCNEIAGNLQETYFFRSAEAGVYTLNFYTSNSEYITKIIYVE